MISWLHAIISHIENRTGHIKDAVSPLVHDIDYINEGLRFGQYFFTEIIRKWHTVPGHVVAVSADYARQIEGCILSRISIEREGTGYKT